jgi:chromosome segregation ATPase
MKDNLKQIFKVRGETVEVFLVPEQSKARYGEPYPDLEKRKKEITHEQYTKDAKELRHETLRERLKHHEDAVSNIKAEMGALEKDLKEDRSDINVESTAEEKTKKQWDKIDKKELKKDTKKEKGEHEEDAIEDDKSKIKKLQKGKPSEKKSAEKKALKRDMKFDKDSKKKMEGEKIKPKKSYAEILMDIAAERFGGKKRSALKDSDFLDPKRRSFPVMSAQDVKDAVSSWGRYKGSMTFDEFKAKLTRRAKKIGAESALPKSWSEKK